MLNAVYAALDRIITRTLIADAIHYGDFPKAERLIEQYVDAELTRLTTRTN